MRVALLSLVGVGFVAAVFLVLVQEGKISFGAEGGAPVAEARLEAEDLDDRSEDAAAPIVAVAAPEPATTPGPSDSVTAPAPAPPQRFTERDPETQEEIRWVRTVAGNFANVRSAGSSQAPILGMVSPGDTLELEDTTRGWRRVRAGSTSGWVWAPVLNLPTGS